MTFYHFGNCVALAYVPYHLTYKFSGLAEYGAFWKCVTAGMVYMVTQLAKMLFLATFFPTGEDDDDAFWSDEKLGASDEALPFIFITEFLKVTVDLADLAGIYFILQRVAGKAQVKVLVAGLGWAFAEFVFTRLLVLWVGARGIEFDWKYIQKSLDANISLVHFLTLSCLVWLWMRKDVNRSLMPVICLLLVASSYQSLMLDTLVHILKIGVWSALLYKAMTTLCLGLVTLQLYIGVTASDKY